MFVEYEDAEYEFEGEMHPYKTWPEVGTRFDSPGSVACAKFLATDGVAMVRGKRMLEVGSGNGLISLIAARAGAMEVIATDADHDEEALARTNAEKFDESGVMSTQRLRWGTKFACRSPLAHRKGDFDVVFGCEVCHIPRYLDDLVATVAYFLAPEGYALFLNMSVSSATTQAEARGVWEESLRKHGLKSEPLPLEKYCVEEHFNEHYKEGGEWSSYFVKLTWA